MLPTMDESPFVGEYQVTWGLEEGGLLGVTWKHRSKSKSSSSWGRSECFDPRAFPESGEPPGLVLVGPRLQSAPGRPEIRARKRAGLNEGPP